MLSTASYLFTRTDSSNHIVKALVYVGVCAGVLIGMMIYLSHNIRWVRLLGYAFLAISLSTQITLLLSRGEVYSLNEAFLLVHNAGFIGEAVEEYIGDIIPAAIIALLCCGFLFWLVNKSQLRIHSYAVLGLLPIATYASFVTIQQSQGRISAFPVVALIPASFGYAKSKYQLYTGDRGSPSIQISNSGIAPHIIYIVDESVRGDLLSINNPQMTTTPYLESISNKIINLGIASSPANYSGASNIVLQSGLRADQLPDKNLRSLKNPGIFSYMQKANYAAFLVNNQLLSVMPDNYMTSRDIAALNGYILPRVDQTIRKNHAIDVTSIDYLEKIIAENDRSFTYLVKWGVHFPYQKAYPVEETIYTPAFTSSSEMRVDPQKTKNTYMNGIRWAVDNFFEKLVERLDGQEVLIVYTADHGQSLLEEGDDNPMQGHATGPNPSSLQATVPLFLLSTHEKVSRDIRELYLPTRHNNVSAFELFPTMLQFAGYNTEQVFQRYGHSIFDQKDNKPRVFVSGNLFGIAKTWINPFVFDSSYSANKLNQETPQ